MDEREHWQGIYTTKATDEVSWYQAEPRISLELIEATGAAKDAAILDVGGGASVLVDHLLDAGYSRLAVLDIAPSALAITLRRLRRRADDVEWFTADIRSWEPPHPFAVWHDRAMFHFLTDPADRLAYIRVLLGATVPDSEVIIGTFAVDGPERCSGQEIVRYDCDDLAAELGESFERIETRREIHKTPGGRDQAFTWCRFTRER